VQFFEQGEIMAQSNSHPRKWWAAGLLSYLVPGLGQVYNGQSARGLLLYCLYSLWGSFVFVTALQTMKRGFTGFHVFLFFFSLFISAAVFIAIIVDAIRGTKKRRDSFELKKFNRWYVYLLAIVISLGVSWSLKLTIRDVMVQPYKIPTASMSPTLLPGDFILSNKLYFCTHNPERGDIAIFTNPKDEKTEWIKRIVGMPGDTVEIRDKGVFINGKLLDEPYACFVDGTERENAGPVVIPANRYYFLGDNRDNSLDSRQFGTIERSRLRGKPSFIYWSVQKKFPFVRLGRIGKRLANGQ
jgi:signal peptidase I